MMKKTGTEAGSTGRASTKVLRRLLGAAVVLMALCLVLAVPATATGTPDTSWYDASQNEFVIDTADELAGLAVLVNNGDSFEGKTVSLGADIDLSGYPNWTPIGNATHAFSGKFHGKTYGISNLYISLPENEYVGLFGNITNEINGIYLSDSFVAGYGYVGSIAGIVNGGSIVDCIVENFIVDGGGHSVGGMAGEICDDSSINACIITDGRIDGNSYVGSVVGTISRISSCSYCIISNCTVAGDYTTGGVAGDIHSSSLNNITISSSTVTGVYDSGGLGGMFWTGANWPGSSAKDCVMNNCTITGSGITGHLWNSEVQNCTLNSCMMSASGIADRVSTGVIDTCTLHDCTIVGESHLGGIAGTISSRSRISDSTLDNCTISGKNDMGGIAGWLYDSSINNCTLNGCNITSTQWGVSGLVHGISHSPGIYNSTHIIDCTLKNCIITGVDSVSGIAGDVTSTNIDGCVLEDCTILGEDLVAGVVSKAINTTVHACEVINCTITGIDNDVGGIGSYIYDGSSITSCLVENSVISGTNNIGGIAGRLWEDSSASSCSINSCTITSKDIHVGGVVGDLWNSDVSDSALINGTIIGKEYVGGIIGGAQGNISNCSVVAGITGTSYVGGITGSLFLGTVSNCISLVQYIDTDGTVPGRIDNSSSFGFVLQNNYAWENMTSNGTLFTSDIGPNEKNGASVSSAEFWNNQSFFEDTLGWDFENTWKMNSGNDKYQLPVLLFMETPVSSDATYLLGEKSEPTPTPTPEPTPAPVPNTDWYSSDKTEFVIYTADELAGLAVLVNNGTSFKDKTVSLGADIDLSGYPNWTPIGKLGAPFIGKFSGAGHVISNIAIDIDYSAEFSYPDDCYAGLFGYGNSDVEISDLTLSNLTVTGDWYVGGIVGSMGEGNFTLRNCSIDNSFITGLTDVGGISGSFGWLNSSILNCTVSNSTIQGDTSIGGISGDIASGIVVKNCAVENTTITGESSVGGISGWVAGDNTLQYNSIQSSTVKGSHQIGGIAGSINQNSSIISCDVDDSTIQGVYRDGSSDYAGGIVGIIDLDSYILNCAVTNSLITAEEDYDYIGGIAGGVAYNSTVSQCVVNGCTIGDTSYLIGGIAGIVGLSGLVDSAGFIVNCAVETSVISGDAYVGGIAGQVCENSSVRNCYAVGNISGKGSVSGVVGSLLQNGSVIASGSFVSDSAIDYRISPHVVLESTLLGNYAWSGMTSNGNLFGSDIGPNEKNGASVSSSEFWNNQSFFEDTLGWDFENTWKMNSGNDKYQLPVLQFQDTPVAGDATYLLGEESEPTPTPIHGCHNISEWQPLDSAPADISSGTVYYYLTNDIELSRTWNITGIGTNVHLCLNGHDVTFVGEAGSIVYIGEEAAFSLYDCTGTGAMSGGNSNAVLNRGTFTLRGGSIENISGSGVYNSGTFVMMGGCIQNCSDRGVFNQNAYTADGLKIYGIFTMSGGVISNCRSSLGGGGVYNGHNAVFTMSGGYIVNCSSDSDGGGVFSAGDFTYSGGNIVNCSADMGGGVYNSYDAVFTMFGGNIINCNADSGSGVMNYNEFTMSGGSIIDCNAEYNGGGVCLSGGGGLQTTFIMSDGVISNCSAKSGGGGVSNAGDFIQSGGTISNCSAKSGGGVCNLEEYTLTGGVISNCSGESGSGLFNLEMCTLTGGVISNCSAKSSGGVVNYLGTLVVSDSVNLTDVYLVTSSASSFIFQVNESFTGSVTDLVVYEVYGTDFTVITTPNTLVVTDGAPYAAQFSLNETLYQGLSLVPSGNDLVIGSVSPTPTPTPTPDDTADFTLNLSSGWNFISIPKALDAGNATAVKLFGSVDTAGNAILGYNAETQSWEQITANTVIKPLSGYWVYSVSSTYIPLTYSDVPTTPGLKSLYPGWNAIGLSADTETSAATFFAGLNWRVALPWSCENGMYDSAIVNGGGSGNSPDRLLTLGNGCWLYVEEANVLPGLTA